MAELARLRSDLAAFAEAIASPLTDWQARSLSLETRTTVVVAPRGGGKSRTLAVLALWSAFRRRETRVLVVSAGEEASRRLLAEVRRLAAGSPLLSGSVLDETAGLITLSTGSEIRSVPASERAIRGWAVDLLLVDEAALVSDDLLLGAALPTTAARPEARIVLASSASVAAGGFYDAAIRGEAGSEHVRTYRWHLDDCDWIAPSVIESMRQSMSEMRFRAEMEGEFASGADALFSRHALERVTADYLPTPLAELRGPARLLAGCDWGATNDRSAFVAIGRLPIPGERIFGVASVRRWPAGAPLSTGVIREIVDSPAHFALVASEMNGLGLPLTQELFRRLRERSAEDGGAAPEGRAVLLSEDDLERELERAERKRRLLADQPPAVRARTPRTFRTQTLAVHTGAELKAAAYSTLRLLIERGQLLLPASAEDLIRELLMLRVDLSPGGTERIEASSGHDDCADGLMLCTAPHRARDGRWTTFLGRAAASERLPEIAPPELDVPTVTTGGGLAVPRLPVWQSPDGSLLSYPAGHDPAAAPAPELRPPPIVVSPTTTRRSP